MHMVHLLYPVGTISGGCYLYLMPVLLRLVQDAGFRFAFGAVRVKFKPSARDMQARIQCCAQSIPKFILLP